MPGASSSCKVLACATSSPRHSRTSSTGTRSPSSTRAAARRSSRSRLRAKAADRFVKIVRSVPRRVALLVLVGLVVASSVAAVIALAHGRTKPSATPIGSGVVVIDTNLAFQGAVAAGTGMVLTSSGEVLTNNHVISGATTIHVVFPKSGHTYKARVVGYDRTADVALPIAKALTIAHSISSGQRSATVHIGATAFLGIEAERVDAPGFGYGGQVASGSGALIAGVVSRGPAASAGLVAGDVITAINGHVVSSPTAITALVVSERPGAKIRVAYVDLSGASHTASVTLGSGPAQ